MKGLFRSLAFHILVLWFIAAYVGGIKYGNDFQVLAYGALALTIVDSLVKPFINILLLPFNLITLGMFRWVSGVFTLYLATLLVHKFSVVPFKYPGFNSNLFIIPQLDFSLLWAYIFLSVLISIFVSFLFWLSK